MNEAIMNTHTCVYRYCTPIAMHGARERKGGGGGGGGKGERGGRIGDYGARSKNSTIWRSSILRTTNVSSNINMQSVDLHTYCFQGSSVKNTRNICHCLHSECVRGQRRM